MPRRGAASQPASAQRPMLRDAGRPSSAIRFSTLHARRASVGSVRAGPLTIRIHPKLTGQHLSTLVGYAVGLPLQLLPEHEVSLATPAFQDLIVSRLASEASQTAGPWDVPYINLTQRASLASPRGRILFKSARSGAAHDRDSPVPVQGRMPPFSHRASALSGSAISSTAPYQNASQPASGRPVNSIRLSG